MALDVPAKLVNKDPKGTAKCSFSRASGVSEVASALAANKNGPISKSIPRAGELDASAFQA